MTGLKSCPTLQVVLVSSMDSKISVKKKKISDLEEDYKRLFTPINDVYDNTLSTDIPRLSPYKSIRTVTTYGAYEEPI